MEPELTNVIELFFAFAFAGFAYIQHRRATGAIAETQAAQQTTNQVLSYFDATDDTVTVAPPEVQGRSYRMADSTKRWLTFDHSPVERESLLRQVAEAEAERLDTYTITVPSAWYDIEYGLIKGSGGSGKGTTL
ncbi:MAG: hypothetical protein NTV68_16625 [Methanomicrobiales archaeon]|nr:hypothetical protein [Methanomicrobiales archaeon]